MVDLDLVRHHPDILDAALRRRASPPLGHQICDLDARTREARTHLQELYTRRRTLAEDIAKARSQGQDASALMDAAATLKQAVPRHEEALTALEGDLHALLMTVPNILDESVPDGRDERDNVCLRTWGTPGVQGFDTFPHEQVAAAHALMSPKLAVAMSGSRFTLLHGPLARLERALAAFMLDLHTEHFGYEEIAPPFLVHRHALEGTGQLPKMEDDLFQTTDGHWLIPTSEVSLANMVADRILTEEDLPLRYVAYTPCFRKEAGAAGKDTHGLIRLHQFSKVELVSITPPEQSADEHERMLSAAEEVLKRLELPFRVILLCAGDTGFHARKTFDLEVWFPHQKCYREISSCSNCGDFQARRMKARVRNTEGKNRLVHTLNGSGVAVGRALAAVIENGQQADGSIRIPDVLHPYMNGLRVIHA